jgi:outer membrane protein OmpA-like peptidoglycan-associated protein
MIVLRAGATLLSAAALAGCAVATQVFAPRKPETLVVVVPSRVDGHVGAVVVSAPGGQQVLDTAYASARVPQGRAPRVATLAPEELERSFAAARRAAPPPPATFTVHFVLGTNELTARSKDTLKAVMAEMGRRAAPDIHVIGHTDQLGPELYNEALSLRRAARVRDYMVAHGFAPALITAIGRGEREPLVDSGLSNPENRRVEIIVR